MILWVKRIPWRWSYSCWKTIAARLLNSAFCFFPVGLKNSTLISGQRLTAPKILGSDKQPSKKDSSFWPFSFSIKKKVFLGEWLTIFGLIKTVGFPPGRLITKICQFFPTWGAAKPTPVGFWQESRVSDNWRQKSFVFGPKSLIGFDFLVKTGWGAVRILSLKVCHA